MTCCLLYPSVQHYPSVAELGTGGPAFNYRGLACQCEAWISSPSHREFASVGIGFIMASHMERSSCQLRAVTHHMIQINLLWTVPRGLRLCIKMTTFLKQFDGNQEPLSAMVPICSN